ncbi:hypothetical protein WKI27_00655 [Brevundimonas vesicularis]|uniref:hypothetical protein n=1 Tax=Brevundimonas vesicularis TaxID=41276 RepID=UPI0030C335F4
MIEPAYQQLASDVAAALVAAGFINVAADLKIDPPAPFTPTGDERTLITAAALVKVRTNPVRQLMGGPTVRYVVERQCQLELAIAGPERLRRDSRVEDALAALAVLQDINPTLSGKAERLVLGEQTDDELPPNGVSFLITFTIRVRSGDALGRTP